LETLAVLFSTERVSAVAGLWFALGTDVGQAQFGCEFVYRGWGGYCPGWLAVFSSSHIDDISALNVFGRVQAVSAVAAIAEAFVAEALAVKFDALRVATVASFDGDGRNRRVSVVGGYLIFRGHLKASI
jgi:hypothetical protein